MTYAARVSSLGTWILAWAALYAYVGGYYVLLYARQRSDREYLSFGVLCFALAIHAFGGSRLAAAESLADAALAVRIQHVGASTIVPWFVDFASDLAGRPRGKLGIAAYVMAFAGLVGSVAGAVVDPERAGPPPAWGWIDAPVPITPAYTAFGHFHLAGLALVGGLALHRLWIHRQAHDDVRWVVAGAVLAVLAALHDVLVRLAALGSIYLLEHVATLAVLAMSYVLLRRFVHAGQELAARTEEVAHAYEALQKSRTELVRKEQLAAVGELSAVIAHEVRNPLAVIKNAVSGLRRKNLQPTDRVTLLDILDEETDRLDRLVRDLLTYAKPVVPGRAQIELRRVVLDAIEQVQSGGGATGIEVQLEVPETARVVGDEDLIRRALLNVVDNAFQAMKGGGTLTISSEPVSLDGVAALAIRIRDTGEGMDTMVRQKARDPFFTTRPSGTGLGLAIVERVVRTHGGKVEIESRHGMGTTVSLVLPEQPR